MNTQSMQHILDTLLAKAVESQVAPGAVAGVEQRQQGRWQSWQAAAGHTCGGKDGTEVELTTAYDLASLTKPLVTVLLAMILVDKGELALTDSLSRLLPGWDIPPDKGDIQLGHLLSHSAGFTPHRPYDLNLLGIAKERRKETLLGHILGEPLLHRPGEEHCYSDIGFILLGAIIEHRRDRRLDEVYSSEVLQPLGLEDNLWFNVNEQTRESCSYAATEVCPWTHKLLSGVVHDDNCRVLGGVAGHAGLFGTLDGVLALARMIIDVYGGLRTTTLFSRELLHKWLKKGAGTTWSLGFDSPAARDSSAGHHFSEHTRGHLGFTGTSLWMDLERSIIVVLLTNRVHPVRSNLAIRRFRPYFHDRVMEGLLGKKTPCPQ